MPGAAYVCCDERGLQQSIRSLLGAKDWQGQLPLKCSTTASKPARPSSKTVPGKQLKGMTKQSSTPQSVRPQA